MHNKLQELMNELKNKFQKNERLKIYSKNIAINNKLDFLKKVDKGIRATCSLILDFFEARVNTNSEAKEYMLVYASQLEMSQELGYSREHISKCISIMCRVFGCPFKKVRQGLGKANYYIMEEKKELMELLEQISEIKKEIADTKKEVFIKPITKVKNGWSDINRDCNGMEDYTIEEELVRALNIKV